ncbi:MAG: HAMP domain-containing histidine kinase [Balneolaceae bacterium]|nr:HAMP domain-containing histidine kinase [Balneolaceae bacterium]MBO6547516.1 HAMP domain-containing histidine kinase [Balneolaceae bacterium]MBO6647537.1 HAMP domain-containing histidine kinase [Balneolaceae bacterium]
MFTSRVQKISSPWVMVVLSVVISEIIYIVIGYLLFGEVEPIGIFFSFIIPSAIAYPISSAKLKQLAKIEAQKEELEHLDRINKRLFSTIAHDIRSPISSASMLIDLTLSGTLSVKESRVQLKEVSSNISVLLAFLDDLLLWSKYQIEKKPLKPEHFQTEELLLQLIQLYKKVISQKNIELKLGNLNSTIYMDKGSYSFVVRNILHNAIKYTSENGLIEISTKETDQHIQTIIKDDGVGMETKKIGSILSKKDYKSSKGTNQESGTGFGLRTAIEYLEEQNGELQIVSNLNEGTKISIVLPKKDTLGT